MRKTLRSLLSIMASPKSPARPSSTVSHPIPPKMVPIPANGVDYRNKVVLAPMVRSGELPNRLLALKYGADLVWGPETVDRSMIGTTRKYNPDTGTIDFSRRSSNMDNLPAEKQRESVIFSLHPEREKGKLIFQLGTAKPETAVAAAKLVAQDVAGIDVNSGCPKPFSTLGGMGAALLKDPDRLCAILEALVKEIGVPHQIGISVKIRLLETSSDTESLVTRLVQTGITGLTIHCRTTPMRPRERAIRDQLSMIGNICRAHGVACLMNGDVASRSEALDLASQYGVDGGMIATAAEKNPSVFRPISSTSSGLAPWTETSSEYLREAISVHNKWGNTKFTLAQLIPGREAVGKLIQGAKTYTEAVEALGMEEELGERAGELDRRLGLDERVERMKREVAEREARVQAGRERERNKVRGKRKRSAEEGDGERRQERRAVGAVMAG